MAYTKDYFDCSILSCPECGKKTITIRPSVESFDDYFHCSGCDYRGNSARHYWSKYDSSDKVVCGITGIIAITKKEYSLSSLGYDVYSIRNNKVVFDTRTTIEKC